MSDMAEVVLFLTVVLWLPSGWLAGGMYSAYALAEHEGETWDALRTLRFVLLIGGWGTFFATLLVVGINSDCKHGAIFRKPRE